jgi:MscS family membrane protein
MRRIGKSCAIPWFFALAISPLVAGALAFAPPIQAQAPTPGPSTATTPSPAAAVATPVEQTTGASAAAVVVATTPTREAPFERNLPAPLRRSSGVLDVRVWQWMALPILLVVAFLFAALTTALVRRVLKRAAAHTRTLVDDEIVRRMRAPLLFAFTIMFFAAGLPVMALPEAAHVFLRGLLKGLGVVALSLAALRFIDYFAQSLGHRLEREGRRRLAALIPLGRRVTKFFLGLIAIVVLLQNVGLDVTGLIAGLGVGGIAVALAAQKTIENVFGGISVIADQPVRVGDLCRFRDGRTGVVEEIGLRSTRIRTPERTLVTIPNADFAQRELENLSMRDRIRLYAVIGLRYETTPDQLRKVLDALRQLIAGHPKVSADTVRIFFIGFGTTSLDVEISAHVRTQDPDEFNVVREELFLRMIDTIAGCGTALARPVSVATLAPAPANVPPAT